jgi:hypothetical protein
VVGASSNKLSGLEEREGETGRGKGERAGWRSRGRLDDGKGGHKRRRDAQRSQSGVHRSRRAGRAAASTKCSQSPRLPLLSQHPQPALSLAAQRSADRRSRACAAARAQAAPSPARLRRHAALLPAESRSLAMCLAVPARRLFAAAMPASCSCAAAMCGRCSSGPCQGCEVQLRCREVP